VRLDHRLHPTLRIAAGADEILVGIVDVIVVELEPRVGDCEAVADRVFRRGFGGGEGRGELRDSRLVARQALLRRLEARGDRLDLGRQGRRVQGGRRTASAMPCPSSSASRARPERGASSGVSAIARSVGSRYELIDRRRGVALRRHGGARGRRGFGGLVQP
jgi:hypothetical protein